MAESTFVTMTSLMTGGAEPAIRRLGLERLGHVVSVKMGLERSALTQDPKVTKNGDGVKKAVQDARQI